MESSIAPSFQVQASPRKLYVSNSSAACAWKRHEECGGPFGQRLLWLGCERAFSEETSGVRAGRTKFCYQPQGGLSACAPVNGWSHIIVPGIASRMLLTNGSVTCSISQLI